MSFESPLSHEVTGLPFPESNSIICYEDDPVVFDPAIHLQLESPAYLKTLDFSHPSKATSPYPPNKNFGGLAFSSPFRILSDAGLAAVREVVFRHERHAKRNERIPKCLRGLGYRSRFIRDLTFCPQVLDFLSSMAGKKIWPHDLGMNVSQINFGIIGGKENVDEWHMDSVEYVMVIILSDISSMVGGELQVARVEDPEEALRMIHMGELPASDTVNYTSAGMAILMQGSKIAHQVTPVKSGKEQRLTLVNSYQSLDPFAPDRSVYRTFKVQDPDGVHQTEWARHAAWRGQGQLDFLVKNPQWGDSDTMLKCLRKTAAELQYAADLIAGKKEDVSPYVVKPLSIEQGKEETKPRARL